MVTRRTFRCAVPAALALVALSVEAAAQGVDWHPSWSRTIIAAQRSGRPILANVYTPGSPIHKQFADTTLNAPAVVAATQDFECVRLSSRSPLPWPETRKIENPREEKDAPVLVFCRPGGDPFYVTFGALKPDKLLYYLGEAKRFWSMEQNAAAVEKQYRGNLPTPETRFELGRWYMLRGGADIRSMMAAAFGGGDGIIGALAGEMSKQMSSGGMPAMDGLAAMAAAPTPEGAGPLGPTAKMPEMAIGLWVGMEQDERLAKPLRARGASLLGLVRRQDPANRLGYAGEIDLLLMQNAMIEERHEEADALAHRYVESNPRGEGVALAYVVQAFGSLSRLEKEQKEDEPPDFTEAKALLEKAMAGPGDDGSKMMAMMMRIVFEMMDALISGFVEAFEGMGEAMEQGMVPE
jgi:hypothetical protein